MTINAGITDALDAKKTPSVNLQKVAHDIVLHRMDISKDQWSPISSHITWLLPLESCRLWCTVPHHHIASMGARPSFTCRPFGLAQIVFFPVERTMKTPCFAKNT